MRHLLVTAAAALNTLLVVMAAHAENPPAGYQLVNDQVKCIFSLNGKFDVMTDGSAVWDGEFKDLSCALIDGPDTDLRPILLSADNITRNVVETRDFGKLYISVKQCPDLDAAAPQGLAPMNWRPCHELYMQPGNLEKLVAFLKFGAASPGTVTSNSTTAGPTTAGQKVTVGTFTLAVPNDWQAFNTNELSAFRREYEVQSEELYRQFSRSNDPSKSVDLAAFDFENKSGLFVVVSLAVPPQANLISLLRSQATEKGNWGVRQGYIKAYLGLVPIEATAYSGFYTKTIANDGHMHISSGLEHKEVKTRILQLTLICPKSWDEVKCVEILSGVTRSFGTK